MREHPGMCAAAPEGSAPPQLTHLDQDLSPHPIELIADEQLVEEVSIDGMCGVY